LGAGINRRPPHTSLDQTYIIAETGGDKSLSRVQRFLGFAIWDLTKGTGERFDFHIIDMPGLAVFRKGIPGRSPRH